MSETTEKCAERLPLALVVNDDRTQLKTLAILLKRAGFRVREHGGAEAALRALQDGVRPDLIVTDIHMPVIDGWHFCRLLRSPDYPQTNATPILVVSATFAGEEVSRITADLGANAFMAAPVDGRRFTECAQMLLRGEAPASRLRALVCEDSDSLVLLLKKTFASRQFETRMARTGREGLALLREETFDIAVLDYHLPDMTGDKLLDEIRTRHPDTATIMMTADRDPELALDWIKRGASGCLTKPFSPEYLLRLCEDARRQRSLLRVPDLLEQRTRKLLLAEERFRKVFEGLSSISIQGYREDGTVFYWNKASESLYGYSAAEAIGGNLFDLIIPEAMKESVRTHVDGMMRTGDGGPAGELCLRRKDGSPVHVYSNYVVLRGESDPEMYCIDIDLSERKRYEAMALQAEKLAALGTLVSGVAHEVNNPNNFVMLNAPLLKEAWQSITPILERYEKEQGDFEVAGLAYSEMKTQIPELFDGIEEGAARIRQIVADLKTYARAEPDTVRMDVDLNDVVESSVRLLRPLVKKATRHFSVRYGDNVPVFKGNPQRLGQVAVNLIVNACEALPDETRAVEVRTGWRPDSREVFFEVRDEGGGIPEALLTKIFDPFFTTKGASGGTGLGLPMCNGIVQDHGGALTFQTAPGKGTIATVTIPVGKRAEENDER